MKKQTKRPNIGLCNTVLTTPPIPAPPPPPSHNAYNVTHPGACPFHVSHACIYAWRRELRLLACFARQTKNKKLPAGQTCKKECPVKCKKVPQVKPHVRSKVNQVQCKKNLAFLQHKESYVTNHRPSSRISPTFSFPASDNQVPVCDGRNNWFAFEDGIDVWRDITEPDGKKREPFQDRLEGEAPETAS